MTSATITLERPASRAQYTGTGQLLRLAWRRDKVMLPLWWVGLVALSVGSAATTRALYPDEAAAQRDLAGIIDNPSIVALYGPLGSASIDALSAFKTVMMGAVFVAMLGLVVVRRHTRAEEDDGRIELVGSAAVTRRAPLAAAVLLGTIAVLVPSIVSALGLMVIGQDPVGSLALGVAWAAPGLAMVGIAAVVVQVAATSRAASGLGFGLIAAFYLVRVIGDSAPERAGLSWLSPLGWVSKTSVYGQNRLWIILLGAAVGGAATIGGFALLDRRDLGGGLIAPRLGPSRASAALSGPLGLTARMARGTYVGWTIGLAIAGALIASLLGAIADLTGNPAVAEILKALGGSAGSLEEIYVAAELRILAVAVSAGGLALGLRLAAAERAGFSEVILAGTVSRWAWFRAHAVVGLLLPTWLMLVFGTSFGVVATSIGTVGAPSLGASVSAALSTLPAAWIVVAMGMALVGHSSRLRLLAWAVLAAWFVVGELGPSMQLPEWALWLSPFTHLSQLPGGSFEATAALVMTAIAIAALVVGGWAYARRDAV